MSDQEAKNIRKWIRGYVTDEIRNPGVQRAKRAFLKGEFSHVPLSLFSPAVLVPVFGLLMAVILLFELKMPVHEKAVKVPAQQAVTEPMPAPLLVSEGPLPVYVKNVSSEFGSTLIYQQPFEDQRLTVFWVFQGGVGQ